MVADATATVPANIKDKKVYPSTSKSKQLATLQMLIFEDCTEISPRCSAGSVLNYDVFNDVCAAVNSTAVSAKMRLQTKTTDYLNHICNTMKEEKRTGDVSDRLLREIQLCIRYECF